MAKLEDVLPALREGKHIKLGSLIVYLKRCALYCKRADSESDKNFQEEFFFDSSAIFANDWELVPEPTRVADYLVKVGYGNGIAVWYQYTHPIGSQPEGSVLVPGSEKEVSE